MIHKTLKKLKPNFTAYFISASPFTFDFSWDKNLDIISLIFIKVDQPYQKIHRGINFFILFIKQRNPPLNMIS